jgi:hypothetical protein
MASASARSTEKVAVSRLLIRAGRLALHCRRPAVARHTNRMVLDVLRLPAIVLGGRVRQPPLPGSRVGEFHGVIAPPQGWTEILLLEVRGDLRLRGVGHAAVQAIAAEYPSTRLAAFSEDADGFWSSLGWAAHVRSTNGPAYRTLFVSG